MNRAMLKQIGNWASYLIVPLVIVGAIYLVTYRRFDLPIIIDLIAIAVAVILYASTNPLTIRGSLGRQMVGSTLSGVVIGLAALGIIILINVLMQRVTVRSDLSASQQFSVSDQTVQVLQKIKDPVTVLVFYQSGNGDTSKSQIQDLLKEYTSRTDKLTVNYVDVNADPVQTREFNIVAVPTVVFRRGTQREDVTTTDEQSFTRALLRVQSDVQRRVFFVTGHNERPITASSDGDSFSSAVTALKNNNYLVDTLNLLNLSTGGAITSTTTVSNTSTISGTTTTQAFKLNPASDVLVFGGPRSPYSDVEKQNIAAFMRQGGKALVLDDPLASAPSVPTERRDNLNDVLKDFDLKFSTGLAVELDPQHLASQSPLIFIPQTLGSSDILRNLQSLPLLIAQSTQVEKGQNKTVAESGPFDTLLQTTANSYLKADLNNLGQAFDQSKDVRGPITVAASYTAPAKEPPPGTTDLNTRLVLAGSYIFASDRQQLGVSPDSGTANYLLFLNSMNWLSEQNNSVVIAPHQANTKPFTVNQSQASFVFWSTFLGLPLLVLFVGLAVYWRRR